MCTLIICRPRGDYALLMAHNRDEDPQRETAPPGLHDLGTDGLPCLAIFPKDRRHGGSWIGCNEHGLVVGLTSWTPGSADPAAGSRGEVALRALASKNLDEALRAIDVHVARAPIRSFQAVVADRERVVWTRHDGQDFEQRELRGSVHVMSDEAAPEEVEIEGLDAWGESLHVEVSTIEETLDKLVVLLATGELRPRAGHEARQAARPLCRSGARSTISSTLLAMPRGSGGDAWKIRYGARPPREAAPRDYSWIASRMRA